LFSATVSSAGEGTKGENGWKVTTVICNELPEQESLCGSHTPLAEQEDEKYSDFIYGP
jgi:hypothetical protein